MTVNYAVVEAFNAALYLLLAAVFFKTFWKIGVSKPIAAGISALGFFIIMTALVVFKDRAFAYVMLFSAFYLLAFMFDSHWLHKLLLTSIFAALSTVAETIVKMLISITFYSSKATNDIEFYISVMLISKAIMLLVVYLIHILKHKPFTKELDGKYFKVIAFPITTAMTIILQHTLVFGRVVWRPTVCYFVLIIDLALFVSNMVVFDYIDSLYDNAVHESKIAHANKLMELQALQYKTMAENSYNINKTKHDFKNFCIGLVSELRAGNTETVIEKLCDVYEETAQLQTDPDNIIIMLIKLKAEEAAKKGVDIRWDCCNLPELRFSDVDLAIILGNAIDNAVEATEKVAENRTVNVFVTFKNNIVVITIKNPVNAAVDVEHLNSTKPDKESHGFGIISMKQLVDKYDGELIFTSDDICFTTSIIMSNLPASLCG